MEIHAVITTVGLASNLSTISSSFLDLLHHARSPDTHTDGSDADAKTKTAGPTSSSTRRSKVRAALLLATGISEALARVLELLEARAGTGILRRLHYPVFHFGRLHHALNATSVLSITSSALWSGYLYLSPTRPKHSFFGGIRTFLSVKSALVCGFLITSATFPTARNLFSTVSLANLVVDATVVGSYLIESALNTTNPLGVRVHSLAGLCQLSAVAVLFGIGSVADVSESTSSTLLWVAGSALWPAIIDATTGELKFAGRARRLKRQTVAEKASMAEHTPEGVANRLWASLGYFLSGLRPIRSVTNGEAAIERTETLQLPEVQQVDELVVAGREYTPPQETPTGEVHMAVKLGDRITVFRKVAEGMAFGLNKRSGDLGLFPENVICTPSHTPPVSHRPDRKVAPTFKTLPHAPVVPISSTPPPRTPRPQPTAQVPLLTVPDPIETRSFIAAKDVTPSADSPEVELTLERGDRLELLRLLPESWGWFRNVRTGELGLAHMSSIDKNDSPVAQNLAAQKRERSPVKHVALFKTMNRPAPQQERAEDVPVDDSDFDYPVPDTVVTVVSKLEAKLVVARDAEVAPELSMFALALDEGDRVSVIRAVGGGLVLGRSLRTGDIGVLEVSKAKW